MGVISKEQFERRLRERLIELEFDLASNTRQRIGYAWRRIIEHMYRERAAGMTFENQNQIMAECAEAIANLARNLKDD
jgi:hypothetical protein